MVYNQSLKRPDQDREIDQAMNAEEQEATNEITVWLNRLNEQPNKSMEIIWQHYFAKLVGHAKKKLRALPRRHVDEEDVASDAMNSLFQGVQAGRFPDLNDRSDLWKLLLTITARKAGKEIRSNMTQKRGSGMTRGESVFYNPAGDEKLGGLDANAIATDPTPDFAVDVVTNCESLLGNLKDDVLRQIAMMKLEGFSNDEIANELDCATRSVERKLNRIRGIWSDESTTESVDSEA
ncbi:MAG: ECF-type sigma factor [Planctomycetota bacterium]